MAIPQTPNQTIKYNRHIIARYLSPLLALVSIGVIYALISTQLSLGLRWWVMVGIAMLVVPFGFALYYQHQPLIQTLRFSILAMITLAEAISTSILVADVALGTQRVSTLPHETALGLLRDAALLWIVNILTFSLWYWQLDGGGPGKRLHKGYHSTDFVFPQVTLAQPTARPWMPHYVDYLFLAFNTSTAFSPTDTMTLSHRAKLLMMAQSLLSLTILAIIAARAINTL